MNLKKFTPDNNSAGEMDECQVICSFLLKTDQQLAKTIEKRVRDLNDPAMGMEIRITFQFLHFLAAWPNMWRIASLLNFLFAASVACVQT